MKLTAFYRLRKPDGTDVVDVNDFNENFDTIDSALHEIAGTAGDLSDGTVFTTQAANRANLASGDTLAVMMGKVMKWFSDLKDAAFSNIANNLTTDTAGYVLDARQGKALNTAIAALQTSFQAGCRVIARAISAGRGTYTSPINGVPTADNASPDTMATNIKTLATNNYSAGVSATKVGTAVAADVVAGKTFTNSSTVGATGSLADYRNNARTVTPSGGTGNESLSLPAGVHNAVTVNRTGPYNAGYNSGYSAGNTAGYNTGYSAGNTAGFAAGRVLTQLKAMVANDGQQTYTFTSAHEYALLVVHLGSAFNPSVLTVSGTATITLLSSANNTVSTLNGTTAVYLIRGAQNGTVVTINSSERYHWGVFASA